MNPNYETSLRRRRLSPQTIRLRLFYLHKLEQHVQLDTATLDDLETFMRRHPHWSDATQVSVIASIRSYYRWAERTGHLPQNPAVELYPPRVHRKPQRMATETEILDGLHNAADDISDRAMLLLGAECGFRVSEIAALHRNNRDGEWLTIVGKGGQQRTVWTSPELAHLLDRIEQTRMRWGHYFPGKSGAHVHPSTVWRHIRHRADIPTHSLRRRAITTVYLDGLDIKAAQEFAGHKNVQTTSDYVQVARDTLRRAGHATRLAA